ncbi:SusC/RagA family TonB-linked outer membrane protein [Microscilla marina]|uniref:SusC/RagA family TonB-linked outer membrane protein n=1 Tax=Microscilla marina TaxID=1027 RepID=UPI0005D473B4|nr:SusC/RagA family TonB-linked outer membrane protein [Microscilla marina]
MKSKFLLTLLFLVGLTTYAFSQITVSGTVTDNNGDGLPGVNVIEKGTSNGAATDVNGKFTLSASKGATLIFSFVGYQNREIKLISGQTDLGTVKLAEEGSLNEVVVTALGLEQNKDQTGTSVSQVATKDLISSGEPQLLNQLAGKAAGVQIISNSGSDPGAGATIRIRGANSISGSNQPLIVIDGIPMYNNTDQAGSGAGGTAGVAQQSRLNDINPNDIASMEVLKGAAAAALYGARALNGVVLITTKSGKASKKGFTVVLNSSIAIDRLNRKVPLQTSYGQGVGGRFQETGTFGTAGSWGDRIAARPGGANTFITDPNDPNYAGRFEANDGKTYYRIPSGTATEPWGGKRSRETFDVYENLFQTGITLNNDISVSSANEKGNLYISFSDTRQEGIIKGNSSYRRTTGRLNSTRYLGKYFTIAAKANYSHIESSRVQRGSNVSGILLGGLRTPADFDMRGYSGTYYDVNNTPYPNLQRAYRNPVGSRNFNSTPNSVYDNPLWIVNNILGDNAVDRFIGSLEFGADPLPWLNLTWRIGMDHYSDIRGDFFPFISAQASGGSYALNNIRNTQFNSDLIARSSFKINDNISSTILVGIGANERKFSQNSSTATNFVNTLAPPILANSSASGRTPISTFSVVRNVGYYYQASFSFYDLVFLNTSGRYEDFSTMSEGFFYPSVDVAFQFSKLLPKNDIFTFGKIRAAWGQVGRAAGAYTDRAVFIDNIAVGDAGWGSFLDPAVYGGGSRQGNTAPAILKPEIKTEIEFGLDARFLKNRVSAGVTYYMNNTVDVIQAINLSPTTGFLFRNANAAEIENRGLELEVSGDIIKTKDWSWSVNANYSRNINNVKSLQGTNRIFLAGFTSTSSNAIVGQQLGTLFGAVWDKNDDGSLILDGDGFPTLATESSVIGDPNAQFRVGFGTSVSYKNFTLRAFFDHSAGGDIWNGTRGALNVFGRPEATATTVTLTAAEAASLKTYSGSTVDQLIANGDYPSANRNADGSVTFRGSRADFGAGTVLLDESWYTTLGGGFGGADEQFIEDATWTRLRELSLSYNLNSEGFRTFTGLQSVQFTVTGRNLFLWTDYTGIDPDTNLSGSAVNGLGLDYFNNPATRSFLFSIKITY